MLLHYDLILIDILSVFLDQNVKIWLMKVKGIHE